MKSWAKIIIFTIGLAIAGSNCPRQSSPQISDNWVPIIRDLELIINSNLPKSAKYSHVQRIFKNNNIRLENYQKLYFRIINDHPQNSLQLLKDIEKLLSDDMKTDANLLRKKSDEKRFRQ